MRPGTNGTLRTSPAALPRSSGFWSYRPLWLPVVCASRFQESVDWYGAVGAVTRSFEAGELGFFAAFLILPELRNLFLIFFKN